MTEELTRTLTRLADRGTPRGSDEVLEGAQRSILDAGTRRRRGVTAAFLGSIITVGTVGVALWLEPADDAQQPSQSSTTIGPAASSEGVHYRLVRDPDAVPARLSTVLGDLEVVTYLPLETETGEVWFSNAVATRHGFFAAEIDDLLWWSSDSETWHLLGRGAGGELRRFGDDVAVLGVGGIVAVYSWEGDTWAESGRVVVDGASDVDEFVAGPDGALVALDGDDIRWSRGGDPFRLAEDPPSPDRLPGQTGAGDCDREDVGAGLGPMYETADGVVLLTASHRADWGSLPVCEPVLWYAEARFSDGNPPSLGNEWELASGPSSPFGPGAAIGEIVHDGRGYIAVGTVGGSGALWQSPDGFDWTPLELDFDSIGTIATGELGWVVTAAQGSDGSNQQMWFYRDGAHWQNPDSIWDGPYPTPTGLLAGYLFPTLAVGEDAIFGMGWRSAPTPIAWRSDPTPVVLRVMPEPNAAPGTLTVAARDWEGMDGYRVLAVVWGDEDLEGGAFWRRVDADPWSGEDVVHPPAFRSDLTGDLGGTAWGDDDYWWDETAELEPGTYRIEITANPGEIIPFGSHIPAAGNERSCFVEVVVESGQDVSLVVTGVPRADPGEPPLCPTGIG
jgi:hypothetical protein